MAANTAKAAANTANTAANTANTAANTANTAAIAEEIRKAHDPGLAALQMVCQLWGDGEITLQKGGDLLWRRTLHTLEPPLPGVNVPMPASAPWGAGCAFLSEAAAREFRRRMGELRPG